jgi:plasmid stabilization system protein ParE
MSHWILEYQGQAVDEAEFAREWYAQRSPRAAEAFLDDLKHALDVVADDPERWPRYDYGTRRYLFRRFPFALIYRITKSRVQIIAVAHLRRRPGYWLAR